MTTIHLYPVQSVVATLLYALQTGNILLAYQCANELNESKESALLWNILTFAWILHTPDHPNETIRYERFQTGDCRSFLESLLNSPFPLPEFFPNMPIQPPKAMEAIPSHLTLPWTKIPINWTYDQAYRLWDTNMQALKKNHWTKALRLTLPLLESNCESVIDMLRAMKMEKMAKLLETTVYMPFAQRVLAHAFASYPMSVQRSIQTDPAVRSIWGNPSYLGGKKGRTFPILAKACAMWDVSMCPTTDLQGLPMLITNENTTQYWKDVQAKYGYTNLLQFKEDDAMEQFYNTYFPDDIPDEWTNEERSKSHGTDTSERIDNIWIPAFVLM